ncbi:hypothetical protein H072_3837 [Dactylellina haptotyla CBS 200.50]|uniref:BTB domain-containing protein n=1 Tax=Dactylellina haptotyla (strain CBS 200.50) TaxID=1284197 RepID=S8AGQ8_DACHA|nr:hypothetical protein H072_3837 [Dactylellina haptotyla CBS 200.50]
MPRSDSTIEEITAEMAIFTPDESTVTEDEIRVEDAEIFSDSYMILSHSEENLKNLISLHDSWSTDKNTAWFPKLFETSRFSDVNFIVGPAKTMIKAHRGILCERSSFFQNLFDKPVDNPHKVHNIRVPDYHVETFRAILRFLYTGQVDHSRHPGYVARLYKEAGSLGIPELQEYAVSYLVNTITHKAPEVMDWALYIIGMINGLAECYSLWSDLEPVFDAIVHMEDFETFSNREEFVKMMDENAVPARILFQKFIRINDRARTTIQKSHSQALRAFEEKVDDLQASADDLEANLRGDIEGKSVVLEGLEAEKKDLEALLDFQAHEIKALKCRIDLLEKDNDELKKQRPKEVKKTGK